MRWTARLKVKLMYTDLQNNAALLDLFAFLHTIGFELVRVNLKH